MPWGLLAKALAISLIETLILELCFALFWGIRDRKDLLLAVWVNVLTNPIVVFVHYFVRLRRLPVNYGAVTCMMEILAVITEALLYKKFSRTVSRPWLFSLSANSFSYAVGELVNGIR